MLIEMNERQNQIRKLLWKEVAYKGTASSITFTVVAGIIFYYYFGLEDLKLQIRIACLFAIVVNVLRLLVSKKITQQDMPTDDQINMVRALVWCNALAWSFIFATGTYGLNSTSYHFAIMVTIMTGYVAASIVTVGYDKTIFFPFQIFLLFPQIGITFYQKMSGQNPYAQYLCICFVIFFLYQIRQYKDYRGQLLERFNALLDLEYSFKELKKSQASLVEQTAKLIHASKISALSDMSGGLAHEVNNSLMVIMGTTQQIERELKRNGTMTSTMEYKFAKSTESILKIKSVIEGLKYFSLQMEPQPKEVISLRLVIERTLLYINEMLKAHNVNLIYDEIPEVNILCHPFQITQILFNLTKNADDAMKSIPIDERWIKYKFELQKDFVLIKIINGGPLIPEEYHMKLFQPFFTTKELNQGSGLSLSTARGMAIDHRGNLYFENADCTTFVLRLPIYRT